MVEFYSLQLVVYPLSRFTELQTLVPTDPTLLARLGNMYDREEDQSMAFQCFQEVGSMRGGCLNHTYNIRVPSCIHVYKYHYCTVRCCAVVYEHLRCKVMDSKPAMCLHMCICTMCISRKACHMRLLLLLLFFQCPGPSILPM